MDNANNAPSTSAWSYYTNTLGAPKLIVAPMVEQSELPWRMLSRAHKAELCYTPMIHSSVFIRDATYRQDFMSKVAEDRPLIAQFCGNDPETLVECANLIAPYCDGVDLNLGCPQTIARRGNYGAFLQDDWTKIYEIVNSIHRLCSVPISCKIRVFEDRAKTIEYAKFIEAAGCQLLTVHGRTREQKGPNTGLADWSIIKAVKEAVQIPVFANGNIQLYDDIENCMQATGVDGVMSAEGNLHNPYLFEPSAHPCHYDVAKEYFNLVDQHPTALSCVRAHLFKLFHHSLMLYPDVRTLLANAVTMDEMRIVVEKMEEKCKPLHEQYTRDPDSIDIGSLLLPHWLCQPYYRDSEMGPDAVRATALRAEFRRQNHQALQALHESTGWSKRRLRRLQRHKTDLDKLCADKTAVNAVVTTYAERRAMARESYVQCGCGNPIGQKCTNHKCKRCCKTVCVEEQLNCISHNLWFGDKTRLYEIMTEKKKRKLEDAAETDGNKASST